MTDNNYVVEWEGSTLTLWIGTKHPEVTEHQSAQGLLILKPVLNAASPRAKHPPIVGARVFNVDDHEAWPWEKLSRALAATIGIGGASHPIWAAARRCNQGIMGFKYESAYGKPIPC